jgi:hypothetical protein
VSVGGGDRFFFSGRERDDTHATHIEEPLRVIKHSVVSFFFFLRRFHFKNLLLCTGAFFFLFLPVITDFGNHHLRFVSFLLLSFFFMLLLLSILLPLCPHLDFLVTVKKKKKKKSISIVTLTFVRDDATMPTDGNVSPGPSATSCVAPQNSDAHLYNAADAARKSPLYSPSPRRYIETSYYYFMCPSYSYPIYTRTHIAD